MDFSLSGNSLKTFARSITCLARIGHDLSIEASPSQLTFTTVNTSRSSFLSITYKPDFFDVYSLPADQARCSLLLKALCALLRTPIGSIDTLRMNLPDPDASRTHWTLDCSTGMRKTYWIACNVEPDIQQLSLDDGKFPSNFIVKPRDLNRLLSNFQSSLQEITIIATEFSSVPSDAAAEIGGKAVEIRSYIDPTKDNDSSLHTQLWIDPMEEFTEYTHSGNPVDVTFGLKELKAFLSFCEGSEVDIHIYFDKAGEPVLMRPRMGLDDGCALNFDATLVLATMLISQLHGGNATAHPAMDAEAHHQPVSTETDAHQTAKAANIYGNSSDHTRIWSDLSAKNASRSGIRTGQDQGEMRINSPREIQRFSTMNISKAASPQRNVAGVTNIYMEADKAPEQQVAGIKEGQGPSQRHPSNWVDADADSEDEDDTEDNELCIESTPPYYD